MFIRLSDGVFPSLEGLEITIKISPMKFCVIQVLPFLNIDFVHFFLPTDGEIKLSTTDLHGKDYHLVAANLKNLKELEHKLHECDIDYSMPTIFIAECVLVYIEKNKTDELLKWITEHFSSAFFVNYEQVGKLI